MTRLFLCIFCAVVATWQYETVALPRCSDCLYVTGKIVEGDFGAPFVYRQLTPRILMALGNTAANHAAFHFTVLVAFFWGLWQWAERWGSNGATAVALTTVALIVMYPTYFFSSYAVVEWLLWLSGLLLLTERWSSSPRSTARSPRFSWLFRGWRSRPAAGAGD